jgi:localization factor PodJL
VSPSKTNPTIGPIEQGIYLRQGNGMAPEVRWQASEPARSSSDFRAPGEDSVETLLRRLIRRIEESERRYSEALDELHARLGHVSHTAGVAESLASPEESETLERLRLQLSGLARRLEQPPPPERAQPLHKALEEVRAVQAGLAGAEPNWFQSRYSPAEPYFADTERASFLSGDEPSYSSPSFDFPSAGERDADSDRRLIEMAQRLERSIGDAMPSTAIDRLNARMEEISARFEAALAETPKLENLRHVERQVTDIGQQLGRVERHAARIGAVESELQRLIARIEEAPAQIELAASKAAQETARLVNEAAAGKPSAAERLDELRRDIVAMNERSLATDDRLVDTLAAMHESVKGLVQQRERDRARITAEPQPSPIKETVSEPGLASVVRPEPPQPAPQAPEPQRRGTTFIRDVPFDSTEDLVAAARRAAQAAAARAVQRDAARRQPAAAEVTRRVTAEPGQHKMSLLMVVAALLLMISAALLFTRLKSKPDLDVPPPAAEQSIPAPAAEAPPLMEPPYQPDVTPNPDADFAPAQPDAPQRPPHAITPGPIGLGNPPPVRLGEDTVEAETMPASLGSGGTMFPPGVSVMVVAPN